MVRGDGQRQSKPGGADFACRGAAKQNDSSNSQCSATHPDATKREPSNSKRRRHTASKSHNPSSHEQRFIRMPRSETFQKAKTHWQIALRRHQVAGLRASITVRPPLRTTHGTTSSVAGIKKNNPKANQTNSPKIRHGITGLAFSGGTPCGPSAATPS